MAPMDGRGEKRKRPARQDSSEQNRPSPHRPDGSNLRQQDDRNNRRSSRGRGGRPRPDRRESSNRMGSNDPNSVPIFPRSQTSQTPAFTTRPPSAGTQQPPSAPSTPAPPSKAPTPEPTRPKREPLPYDYTYLTEERIGGWGSNGRTEVIAAGKRAMQDHDELEAAAIFQECLRSALDGRIGPLDVGGCVKEILDDSIDSPERLDGPRIFLDSFSIMMETDTFDPILQPLIAASGVSEVLMRQVLDAPLLQSLGLTRSTFIKAGIRQVTNLLYRQANHNLLREETEGYSKLITELFTISATSSSEHLSDEVVEETFEKVKGLIGTFDLDVGRVLDVTMDVFAAVLIKQFRFFIKLLRVSSWWPRESGTRTITVPGYNESGLPVWALPGSGIWSTTEEDELSAASLRQGRDTLFWHRAREIGLDAFFELGGRRALTGATTEATLLATRDDIALHEASASWIESTGTVPPAGNRTAAQLLGFKLRFYSSAARDKEDVLPANLIYLAALLIKIGFISLPDLYPHLWPADDAMEQVRSARMKELAEKEKANRPGGANNALMMAGALADDTLPTTGRSRETATAKTETTSSDAAKAPTQEQLDEPKDQKVQLLTNLLTIGALPESLFILGKFPWLPEAFPEIYDLIHRILHFSIQKVFEQDRTPEVFGDAPVAKKATEIDQTLVQKFRQIEAPTRKALRWPFADQSDVNEGMNYRFYWDEWADNVPVCQNVDDIFTLCSTFLNISGVNIGRDVSLLSKLASIGNRSLANDRSESNLARWQDLLKRLLVPALSFTKANTSIVNDIFDMLRYYPAPIRYNIYAEWFEGQTSRLPAMQTVFSRTKLETLATMKRISKTNITSMARALAKTAYASPGIVFKVALDQIEAYSNLTEVVVECAKYFTDLGYDVLLWSLMSSVGGQNRSRTRADDALLTSRWLIALSRFSGKVFKRYSIMNPTPILQYVNDQLYLGNSTDLIILEQLIAQMAGVVSDVDFTDAQLLAMTGGKLLRRQTLINLQDKRYESTKTAKRLIKSLIDTKLAGQLLVAIAQHQQAAVYAVPEDEAHIKYLATVVDDTQRILFQYLDLLRSNLDVQVFDALVPGIGELMQDFNLEPSLAFLLGRASFAQRLSAAQIPAAKSDTTTTLSTVKTIRQDSDGDAIMESRDNITVENGDNNSTVNADDVAMENTLVDGDDTPTKPSTPPAALEPWKDELEPLVHAVKKVLPAEIWDLLDPSFYAVFWQLSLADIHLPMDSYTAENTRLTREISEIMRDRSDTTRSGIARRDEARKLLEVTRDDLLKESKQEMIRYERSRTRLNKEKTLWFSRCRGRFNPLNDMLLEKCLVPRFLLSPSDADYCFRMIKFLHNNGATHFRTAGLFARFFRVNRLRTLIFTCTIREAENLGRFIKLVLTDLARWHTSKTIYEKEAGGVNKDLAGFAKKTDEDGKPEALISHEDFRKALFTWHKNLFVALKTCLSGKEWMHIRNGITVLKGVVEAFPAVDFMGKQFQEILTRVGKDEKEVRDDLSLTANALLPELKKRELKWVIVQAFATNTGDIGAQANGDKNGASKTCLKPTAPEFKPQASNVSAHGSTSKSATTDVEDGELSDVRNTGAMKQDASVKAEIKEETSSRAKTDPREAASQSSSHRPVPDRSSSRAEAHKTPAYESSAKASALPNRPEVPIPSHAELDRHRSRTNGRDDPVPRHDRGSELSRDRLRESGRRGTPDVPSYGSGRINDRYDSDRDSHDTRRRETTRDSRDSRERRSDRATNNDSRSESRASGSQDDRGPLVNPERLALVNSGMNAIGQRTDPDRAALMLTSADLGRPQSTQRDGHGSRSSSRAHSPRGDRHSDRSRDDRQFGSANDVPLADRQDSRRRDDAMPAPSGPRGDRHNDRGPADRNRDVFSNKSFGSAPSDPDHGRLSRSQQDSNYGRLNPTSDAPSGPRGRNTSTNNRTGAAQIPSSDSRGSHSEISQPQAMNPPTGPSNGRGGRNVSITAGPPNPAPQPSVPGLHPSRAGIIFDKPPAQSLPTPQAAPSEPPIHPSRQGVIQQDQQYGRMPSVQTNIPSGPSMSSPHGSAPPSGPRGSANRAPTSPHTPTGPSTTGETARSGDGARRQLRGLQNIISAGPGQGATNQPGPPPVHDRVMNIKGRGRNSQGGQDYQNPNLLPPTGLPPTQNDRDLINPERLSNLRVDDTRNDPRDSRGAGRGRDPSGRHDSGRGSRRSSRDRSPRRDRVEAMEKESQDRGANREPRGRRSGRDGDRDRDRGHNSDRNRDRGGARPGEQGHVEDNSSGWRGNRMPGAGMDDGSDRRGGPREPRNDGRRDSRGMPGRGIESGGGLDDGSGPRKRSSNEVPNDMRFDGDKRPRRR